MQGLPLHMFERLWKNMHHTSLSIMHVLVKQYDYPTVLSTRLFLAIEPHSAPLVNKHVGSLYSSVVVNELILRMQGWFSLTACLTTCLVWAHGVQCLVLKGLFFTIGFQINLTGASDSKRSLFCVPWCHFNFFALCSVGFCSRPFFCGDWQ